MEVDQKRKSYQEECHLVPEIQPNLNETVSPIEIFSLVTGLEELLELIVEESDLYAHQNGRNVTVTKEELKVVLAMNFAIAINKLPTIAEHRRIDNLIGNGGIPNTMIRNRFVKSFKIYILQITESTIKLTRFSR